MLRTKGRVFMLKLFVIIGCVWIQSLFASPKIVIGIAGGSGSGKTYLAKKIQQALPEHTIVISQDSYYRDLCHLSLAERARTNFDHPDALDFGLLCKNLIALKSGISIEEPIYNFSIHTRDNQTNRVDPAPVIILEGILLFAIPEVRDLLDLKIFVDTDNDIRVLRRMERDINERGRDFAGVKKQYLATVKPMHDAFVEPTKQFADIIIPAHSDNEIALSLILAKLQAILKLDFATF